MRYDEFQHRTDSNHDFRCGRRSAHPLRADTQEVRDEVSAGDASFRAGHAHGLLLRTNDLLRSYTDPDYRREKLRYLNLGLDLEFLADDDRLGCLRRRTYPQ